MMMDGGMMSGWFGAICFAIAVLVVVLLVVLILWIIKQIRKS